MAGIPLSEYIRRRRMSLAAVDLQSKNMKIIDVAGKYGYNFPIAFNRAFLSVRRSCLKSQSKEWKKCITELKQKTRSVS